MEGRRRRLLGVVLGVLTASTCLLILEVGIRFDDWRRAGQPKAPPQNLALLQKNPAGTGSYRLRPNLDLRTRVETTDIRIRTNTHGMHWRETALAGAAGRHRVAFLGDSFTFGSWARDFEHTFVGVFESSLSTGRVEALNFGVGGYGLGDEELLLQESVLRFSPAYVVVVSYMGNDFRDTWLGLKREDIVDGVARINEANMRDRVAPRYLVSDDRIPITCPPARWRAIAEYSAAFRRLAPLLDLEDLCVIFRPNRNFFQPAFWSLRPPPEGLIQAKDAVLESLSRMDALATAKGARLAVVAMPTSAQVYAQESRGRAFDTAFPQAYLEEFCARHRVPYLDLLPAFQAQAAVSNRRLYYRTDIHLTDFGHQRAGEVMAKWFESSVRR